MRDLSCLGVICRLGVVLSLEVLSRLNFGVGGRPVDKLGVKTEGGSGVICSRDGAINT